MDRNSLRARGAIAALVRCPVSAADDKLTGTIARTDRVALPGHCYRSTARIARRYTVGVWRDLIGAARHQVARASNTRWGRVLDCDRLSASGAITAIICRPVSAADDKLARTIA